MTTIDNSGWLKIIGGCECSGFVPSLTYAYNAGAKTMTVTNATTYPAGDSAKIVHVYVRDKYGNQVYGHIDTATGNVAADTTPLNPLYGLNVLATVVTTKRCVADLSVYDVAAYTTTSGSLGNIDNQGSVA